MQSWYAARFEREMGCTGGELAAWLPGACGDRPIAWVQDGADIPIDPGKMRLRWRALEPRRIALLRMPRLAVQFEFDGVDEPTRQQVMRYFDLYTQRGGG